MRCRALASALEERGWRCWFATTRESAAFLAPRRPIVVPAGARGAPVVARVMNEKKIDCLVVDHYGLDASFERAARGDARVVAVIDDLADRPHDCDVIVDADPGRRAAAYARAGAGRARTLLGTRYALLRSEIGRLRMDRPRAGASGSRVLITLGGADPAGLSGRILAALPKGGAPGIEAALVVGPANRRRQRLVRQAAARGVACLVAPRDLLRRMAGASVVVTAAGTTCWELACLGVPVIVVVTAENQRACARAIRRAGAGIVFERADDRAIRGVARAVRRLSRDPARRRRMATAGRRLVDGRGAARVARLIARMAATRREGEPS